MDSIHSHQDYKNTLHRIERLLSKGSQYVSIAELSEITRLRALATAYEKHHYDYSLNEKELQSA